MKTKALIVINLVFATAGSGGQDSANKISNLHVTRLK